MGGPPPPRMGGPPIMKRPIPIKKAAGISSSKPKIKPLFWEVYPPSNIP